MDNLQSVLMEEGDVVLVDNYQVRGAPEREREQGQTESTQGDRKEQKLREGAHRGARSIYGDKGWVHIEGEQGAQTGRRSTRREQRASGERGST